MTELGDLPPDREGCARGGPYSLRLHRHVGQGVAGGEGVHVGKDEVAGAVASEPGLVLAPDDGEGVEDVGCVVLVEAVEVEVEGVEAARAGGGAPPPARRRGGG